MNIFDSALRYYANGPKQAAERFLDAIERADTEAMVHEMAALDGPFDPTRPGDRHLAAALFAFFSGSSPVVHEPREDWTLATHAVVPLTCTSDGISGRLNLGTVRLGSSWKVYGLAEFDPMRTARQRLSSSVTTKFDA